MNNFFLILLFISYHNALFAAGGCASLVPQNDCSSACDTMCTYYTFSPATSSKEILKLPFEFFQAKPSGSYCDLIGESNIDSVLEILPFNIGGIDILKLPFTLILNYKVPAINNKLMPACE
jgi:hypothetical protein